MSEAPPEVEREDAGSRRRYVIRRPEGEAELTLEVAAPGRVVADHTFVPPALRGRGLAQALLAALLDDARAQGFRIVPRCPFVAAEARRHPDRVGLFAA